jgi:osmotically-inducible protein OsmY
MRDLERLIGTYRRSPVPPPISENYCRKRQIKSDERLREEILQRLLDADDLELGELAVDVNAAVVILEGSVPERFMRLKVEALVDDVAGVRDIENQLRVTYDAYDHN